MAAERLAADVMSATVLAEVGPAVGLIEAPLKCSVPAEVGFANTKERLEAAAGSAAATLFTTTRFAT